jgi:hypothetical protein
MIRELAAGKEPGDVLVTTETTQQYLHYPGNVRGRGRLAPVEPVGGRRGERGPNPEINNSLSRLSESN